MTASTHIVLGHGEVGSAIAQLLDADWIDIEEQQVSRSQYDYLHVAIPHSDDFDELVKEHRDRLGVSLVVIHSTVPVGTSERLGAVYSPMRGRHPALFESLTIFVKFFAGRDAEKAAAEFSARNVDTRIAKDSRSLEAMKIWDTSQHGIAIRLMQEIHRFCAEHDLDFDTVYTAANDTYNEGYKAIGMPQFCRPVLEYMGDDIGGHCVKQNAVMLDSWAAEIILNAESRYL